MRPTITFCVIMQSSHRVTLLPPIFIPFLVTGSIAAFNCLGFVFHDPCSQEKRDCAAASLNTAHKILVASKIINSYSQSENVPEVRDNLLAVERTDEHIVNLTNFVDNAVTVHTDAPSASMRLFSGITNPYPAQDVLRFLSRKFEVYRFPWDAADVAGTQIAKISFPDALLGLNTIVDKLRWFKYMRSSVEIEIRLNTTQFHYGQLMVTWLPFYRGGPADVDRYRTANMWVASNNNPMTMSAAQSSSLTFTIPYMSPFSYFDIHGTGLWDPTCTIGTVFVHAITPLGVASQALTTVDCVVFASFKDPDVAGYNPNNLVYLPVAEAQSGRVADEASKKASQNTILSVQNTVETATGFIKEVTGAGADLLQLATTLAPVAMALLDKPRNAQPMQPVYLANAQDICTGDGTDNAVPLSLCTDVNLNATTPIMDTSPSQPTLLSLIMHPSLIDTFTIDVTQAVSSLSYSTKAIPNVFHAVGVGGLVAAGPLAWHSQFFKFWRGSMKYTFQFRTSSFTTARVRIWHMPENSDPVTAPLDAGDVVTALLDIRGDTDFSFTVPYLQRAPWAPVRFGTPLSPDYRYDDMKVAVTLVTSPLSPDATDDATIHCSVWKAAGEDFQFNQYLDQTRVILGTQGINWTGVAEAQSLVETFSRPFDTVIPGVHFEVERGYVSPETPFYLTDLMKRYSPGAPISTALQVFDASVPYDVAMSQTAFPNNLQLLLSGFMFWRGSLRKKTVWLQASSGNYMSSFGWSPGTSLADTDSGALYLSSSTNPVMGVELPWYYAVPFKPLYQSLTAYGSSVYSQSVSFQTLSPSPNLLTLHAVGEDFGVAMLTGYPMIDFSLPPSKSPTPSPSSVNVAPRGASARTHSTGTGLSSF